MPFRPSTVSLIDVCVCDCLYVFTVWDRTTAHITEPPFRKRRQKVNGESRGCTTVSRTVHRWRSPRKYIYIYIFLHPCIWTTKVLHIAPVGKGNFIHGRLTSLAIAISPIPPYIWPYHTTTPRAFRLLRGTCSQQPRSSHRSCGGNHSFTLPIPPLLCSINVDGAKERPYFSKIYAFHIFSTSSVDLMYRCSFHKSQNAETIVQLLIRLSFSTRRKENRNRGTNRQRKKGIEREG